MQPHRLFSNIITFYLKNASTLDGIFIFPAPYWQGVCRADWLNLFIVRSRERFPLPVRPPACCSGCPHRAEVSLWSPLELPAIVSPAPDAAPCLPSSVMILRFTLYRADKSWRSSLSGANLFKRKPLKAAAYWYSVVKFHTFRRKACNKHTKFCTIFLGIKIPICRNHGYVCSYSGFPYMKHLKTGKKKNAAPYHDNALPKTKSLLYIQT